MSAVINAQPVEDETIEITIRDKYNVKISKCDKERIQKEYWGQRSGYLFARSGKQMHQLVIGNRPKTIPEDYVIDHADRDKMNNCRSNLRWVTAQFNAWNTAIQGKSRFKGVSYNTTRKKWDARFAKKHLGLYSIEREAAKAVAREAIRRWPLWAPASDLLIGENLLTKEEIQDIQRRLEEEVAVAPIVRELPIGVCIHRGQYVAQYRGQLLGTFKTVAEAEEVYKHQKQEIEDFEQREHYTKDITRNADGIAIIGLTQGQVALVDDNLWYHLTYKRSWGLSGEYAFGGGTRMHQLVFQLLHPQYVPSNEFSIDHRSHQHKLDNRGSNLRLATKNQQSYNRGPRGVTSQYFGVSWVTSREVWDVTICKDNKTFRGGKYLLETDAAQSYNALAKEHYGDFAKVNEIPEAAISVGFDDDNKRIGLAAQRKRLQLIEEA